MLLEVFELLLAVGIGVRVGCAVGWGFAVGLASSVASRLNENAGWRVGGVVSSAASLLAKVQAASKTLKTANKTFLRGAGCMDYPFACCSTVTDTHAKTCVPFFHPLRV